MRSTLRPRDHCDTILSALRAHCKMAVDDRLLAKCDGASIEPTCPSGLFAPDAASTRESADVPTRTTEVPDAGSEELDSGAARETRHRDPISEADAAAWAELGARDQLRTFRDHDGIDLWRRPRQVIADLHSLTGGVVDLDSPRVFFAREGQHRRVGLAACDLRAPPRAGQAPRR